MPYREHLRRLPLIDILGRLGTTALIAFTLNTARDAYAQDPEDHRNPQSVAEVLPAEISDRHIETEGRIAVALTDSRLRAEPNTTRARKNKAIRAFSSWDWDGHTTIPMNSSCLAVRPTGMPRFSCPVVAISS